MLLHFLKRLKLLLVFHLERDKKNYGLLLSDI